MGFEIYVQCFGETLRRGLSRACLRALFPIIEEKSEPDFWHVRYDVKNSCHIGITPLAPAKDRIQSLYVDRPCPDPLLWVALFSLLCMGSVVVYWPGGPPVVSPSAMIAALPQSMLSAIGPPRVVHSASEISDLLGST
jgi:hypothetical protein